MASVFLRDCGATYVHVPKTAGYSVRELLAQADIDKEIRPMRGLARPMRAAAWAERCFGRGMWRTWTFAFVRNPWDWTVSGWLHVTRNAPCYDDPPEFGAFVRGDWRQNLKGPSPHRSKFRTAAVSVGVHTQIDQWRHLAPAFWRRMPEYAFIGRFERLGEDWGRIAERLGLDPVLPHANRSERAHYSTYYDDETRRLVARRNARLIDRFGYRFES